VVVVVVEVVGQIKSPFAHGEAVGMMMLVVEVSPGVG